MNTVTVTANAAQGLTCFHQYQEASLKTLTIDMLYTSLDSFKTITTMSRVEGDGGKSKPVWPKDYERAYSYIGSVTDQSVEIHTENNFEPDVGLASSSSGYACLAGGITRLLSSSEKLRDISELARKGSFSASASVTGGISIVRRSGYGIPTYGEQVFSPGELEDITVVVAFARYHKDNHNFYEEAASSPMLEPVRHLVANTADQMIKGLETRDIDRLADLSERHSVLNYAVLHTGHNNLFLWQPETVATMVFTRNLRQKNGEPVYYSMNTGANVFIYCFSDTAHHKVVQGLQDLGVEHRSSKVGGALQYLNNLPGTSVKPAD
ncbi:hypothetical protein [Kiloniella laminariae]|uniref:hypothetical protein n=1 Tax=Kiloniella laminariae TaxID=454162 RepID=UPI00036827B5|nr:hypothetical protein [Kiloniella laminariae]